MALPKNQKKLRTDISEAIQRAVAGESEAQPSTSPGWTPKPSLANKTGRPSPRAGGSVRQTLLLSEETAERLTMAFATEQIKRRKEHGKIDKSMFIEEMIIAWLETNGK